jgi:hypothetical protein
VADRANFELYQDPASHTALLKVEQDSQFAARMILKTSDVREFPVTVVALLSSDPEEFRCETPADLDEALAEFVASPGMHQLLSSIMAGQ